MTTEVNFDGLVGPTHNYAGLSFGNKASLAHGGARSNPQAAALQGLSKMRALLKLGLTQGVFPPHERPLVPALRRLGFGGTDENVVTAAAAAEPQLLSNMCSSSAMWTANAATVSPSADTADGRVHFTPANLIAMTHRSFERSTTKRILAKAFKSDTHFKVHDALPPHETFGDEGAANHNRLAGAHGGLGLELFVYGRSATAGAGVKTNFPGRQTLEASRAVARLHELDMQRAVFARQSAEAINAGAFHNDVVCVSNETVLLYHAQAFDVSAALEDEIRTAAAPLGFEPVFMSVTPGELSLDRAVKSYFFNSQLVTLPSGGMALILPSDAEDMADAKALAQACVAGDNPIKEAHFFNLRESMQNGGGPACLRLRVSLTQSEIDHVHAPLLTDLQKLDALEAWVRSHYRDRLDPKDLADPKLLIEAQSALDALTQILDLGSFYHFQCNDTASYLSAE